MSESKPIYIINQGQPRLGEVRPETTYFRLAILAEQHAFVKEQGNASEFIRQMIDIPRDPNVIEAANRLGVSLVDFVRNAVDEFIKEPPSTPVPLPDGEQPIK